MIGFIRIGPASVSVTSVSASVPKSAPASSLKPVSVSIPTSESTTVSVSLPASEPVSVSVVKVHLNFRFHSAI
jgi:hypothetical protein